MICAALAAPHVAVLGDNPYIADANVIEWTGSARRNGAARAANGGAGWRPPHQPGGRVVLWPRRYWPRQPQDIDSAIIQAWKLRCAGLITEIDLIVRETEFHAMRGWGR